MKTARTRPRGDVSADLLGEMLTHPYFESAPPKSAGHREFGAQFAWRMQSIAESLKVSRDDILATAAALTGVTVADACDRFVGKGVIDTMFLTGGGRAQSRDRVRARTTAERNRHPAHR